MATFGPDIGRVAISRAGRDRGRAFLIVAAGSDYVYLADGDLRVFAHPKKKKLKHVALKPQVAENFRENVLKGAFVLDSDVRKALKLLGYSACQINMGEERANAQG
nr:KOW domain-containing RNA-binding protein [bacterium]